MSVAIATFQCVQTKQRWGVSRCRRFARVFRKPAGVQHDFVAFFQSSFDDDKNVIAVSELDGSPLRTVFRFDPAEVSLFSFDDGGNRNSQNVPVSCDDHLNLGTHAWLQTLI